MPVLKIDSGHSGKALARYVRYDLKGKEREESFASNLGAPKDAQGAEREFRLTREHFGKTDGVQSYQAYLSFERTDLGDMANPDGSPNWQRLANYGAEWAHRAGIGDRHQFYVVAHGDKPHPHIHVVWNAVSDADGRKYHHEDHGRAHLDRLRDVNDQLARDHGIRRQLDRNRDPERAPDKVIREAHRGAENYSWKMDLQNRIKGIAAQSVDEQRFIRDLGRMGVEVRVRGQGYSYSFKDAAGMKRVIRGARLGEPYRRDAILERLSVHREGLLQPGGPDRLASWIRAERKEFQSWKAELRQSIQQAKRRASGEDQFRARLESKGVRLQVADDRSYRYSFTDRLGVHHDGVPDSSLGGAYRREHLKHDFQENAIRKKATADIAWASRGARTEAEFSSRLARRGITVTKAGERYRYSLDTSMGPRRFQGEALSRHVSTEAVKLRYAENAGLREVHQKVSSARSLAGTPQEYLARLQARGIEIHRDDAGKALLRYRGDAHDATQFARTPLDQATFWGGTRTGRAMATALEGIAQRITRDARSASREDYYEGPDLVRTRERHGRLRPAMDTESIDERI